MSEQQAIRVLMVCLGNICRSPTAHAVMQHKIDAAGLQQHIVVDSAGTADYHIGKAPDPRSVAAGAKRGYDLRSLRARQVAATDFAGFDHIVAMDRANHDELQQLRPPQLTGARLALLLDYAASEGRASSNEVPDPYYGAGDGFERVLDLVEAGCEGLLLVLQQQLARRG